MAKLLAVHDGISTIVVAKAKFPSSETKVSRIDALLGAYSAGLPAWEKLQGGACKVPSRW